MVPLIHGHPKAEFVLQYASTVGRTFTPIMTCIAKYALSSGIESCIQFGSPFGREDIFCWAYLLNCKLYIKIYNELYKVLYAYINIPFLRSILS